MPRPYARITPFLTAMRMMKRRRVSPLTNVCLCSIEAAPPLPSSDWPLEWDQSEEGS